MEFRITFKNVPADKLPQVVDAFTAAGNHTDVTVASESTARMYEVFTDWSEDLPDTSQALQNLHEWTHRGSVDVTREPPE